MNVRTAALFPGQGAYLPGAMAEVVRASADVRDVIERIDGVTQEYEGDPALPLLAETDVPSLEDLAENPGRLSLIIFAASVGLFEFLRSEGHRFDVLIGHSVGEIAALTAAGSLTVEDATRMIWERDVALRTSRSPEGGMVALATNSRRADHLRGAVDDGSVAIAAYNAPRQTVLSGAEEGLAALERVAAALEVGSRRLAAPYPYHNAMLGGASRRFGEALARIKTEIPECRVHSPILGREVMDESDAREVLARHLTWPVRFLRAVRAVHADGVDAFAECGARGALTGLAAQSLPADVRTVAPLARRASLEEIRAAFESWPDSAAQQPRTKDPEAKQPEPEQPEAEKPETEKPQTEKPEAERSEAEQPEAERPQAESAEAASDAQTTESSEPKSDSSAPADDDLFTELQELYAEVVGYPPEVFTEDAQLEAELGIDSLRQTRLLTKVAEKYDVPGPESGGRLSDYPTLRHIVDAVREARST
ncbi:acyltransferase domain-containing protein [Spirillospora sp. NPDC048911]|uniref:acyltransferase domain-containing protein n=1 Tax=Spirillospora sp. NPDC048911 TaxID=3364527 RepID=UPI003715DCE7